MFTDIKNHPFSFPLQTAVCVCLLVRIERFKLFCIDFEIVIAMHLTPLMLESFLMHKSNLKVLRTHSITLCNFFSCTTSLARYHLQKHSITREKSHINLNRRWHLFSFLTALAYKLPDMIRQKSPVRFVFVAC